MIDYRYIKAFMLTAENKSFSKAAEKLKVAQSAISRQIKLMEEAVGEELILRSSKKMTLTNKGKELFLAIKSFDQMAESIFKSEDSTPLRIGILHGLLENWLAPLIPYYYQQYSRSLEIHMDGPENLKRAAESGKFDCIFSTENIQSDLVTSRKLFDEELMLISKKEINIKNLKNERWIIYDDKDHLFKLSKNRPENYIRVDSITAIVNLVREGVGIAIVPGHLLKKNEGLFTYKLSQALSSQIYMATLNYKTFPKKIQELMDIIEKHHKVLNFY